MSWTLKGRLESAQGQDARLSECRVEVYFDQSIPAERTLQPVALAAPAAAGDAAAAEVTEGAPRGRSIRTLGAAAPAEVAVGPRSVATVAPTTVQRRVTATTDSLGKFEVTLPEFDALASKKLRFVVSAPSGQTVAEETRDADRLDDVVRITIRKVEAIALTPPEAPVKPESRRMTGRIIERNGKPLPASLQVLIFARTRKAGSTETDAEAKAAAAATAPVFVARADSSGYFFGTAPNRGYDDAAALVAGVPDEIPIPLDEGLIPSHVILVIDRSDMVDAPDGDGSSGDTKVPPRTPSQSDLENAPETYSTDLGTGGCVEFNTPNRSIEEFDFYSVVRTTEPEIKGYTLDPTPEAEPTRAGSTDPTTTGAVETTGVAAVPVLTMVAGGATTTAETRPLAASFTVSLDTGNRGGWGEIWVYLLTNDRGRFAIYHKDSVNHAAGTPIPNLNIPELAALVLAENTRTSGEAKANTDAITGIGMDLSKIIQVELVWQESNIGDAWDFKGIEIVATTVQGARMPILVNERLAYSEDPRIRGFSFIPLDTSGGESHRWMGLARAAAAQTTASASSAMSAATSPGSTMAERLAAVPRQRWESLGQVAKRPLGRAELDANNPPDWDSTPTFYEAVTIAHGHLLHFKQVWYADGYSLGDLLYSLPLAPGQKKMISVVDWERRERAERTEATFGSEELQAALSRDRDLGEVVTAALTESARGGSKSTSAGIGAGGGAAGNGSYEGMNFGALVGVSGGYGEANSAAWQDSVRNLSSSSLQTLRDRTVQSASAVRGTRSSIVHSVSQGEAVRATTEVVANHNHCHALTIQYFEVLRHLKLVHELSDVQECLFVPFPMAAFDREKVLRWRQSLETYLHRRELAGGFDATRRVVTKWNEVDYPVDRYADEMIDWIAGELELTVFIPLPPFPERPKPDPAEAAADAATKMNNAVNPTTGPLGILLAIATGGASLAVGAATQAAIDTSKAAAQGARAIADELYQLSPQERYDKFQQEIMPGVVEGFVDQLELWSLVGTSPRRIPADFTLVSTYQPGTPLLAAVRASVGGQIRRSEVSQLVIKSASGLPSGCKAIVNKATIRYRTRSFEHALVDDLRVNDDLDMPKVAPVFDTAGELSIKQTGLGSGATLYTPIDSWEQRRPRREDQRLSAELVDHLNDNLEFYHHVIWWTMDPNRRYMLLDGFHAPGSVERSVASVVENRLIGIVGNSLVLPVARGVHLDPRFKPGTGTDATDLLTYYAVDPPVPASRVSLPTRGVFAEAVMGQCNACEQVDDTRYWRWEESPIDEPPSIEPASTATRRAEPASTLPTPFPTPIVAIQNAPAAPDPAGVAAALDTISKQSFADITGLAGTQANAAAAYSQALDTAYKFGKEASTLAQQAGVLAQQQGMQKNIDKTMNSIDKAESGGKISKEDAASLRVSALKKMVGDGGSSVDAGDVQKRLDIISGAAKDGSVLPQDAQGLSKSVLQGLTGDTTPSQNAETIRDLSSQLDPQAVEAVKSYTDGSFEIQQAAYPVGSRTAPASKTGMSNLASNQGTPSNYVTGVLKGSKDWINAVGDGLAAWKDSPSTELTDALTGALIEAAEDAAGAAIDDIPALRAIKIAAAYSMAFADGVGEQLTRTNERLNTAYNAALARDPGSDGYSEEDLRALRHLLAYQLNAVNELEGILRAGLDEVVEKAIGDFAGWAKGAVAKKFAAATTSLVTHLLEKSPLMSLVSGAVEAVERGLPDARKELYGAALSSTLSLFVRQLENPKLRTALTQMTTTAIGGKEPLDKSIVVAIASCLVNSATQESGLKGLAEELNAETRTWMYQRAKATMDALIGKGVTVTSAPSGTKPSVSGNTIKIPGDLLTRIQNGEQAAADEDYRKWIDVETAVGPVRQATAQRLTVLSKVRQPRFVYLAQYAAAGKAEDEYSKYKTECIAACRYVATLYSQLIGPGQVSLFGGATALTFEFVDYPAFNVRYIASYDLKLDNGTFQRGPKVRQAGTPLPDET